MSSQMPDRLTSRVALPRAAYVHVPFCARRCGYCTFTVIAGRDDLFNPYLTAIQRELSWLGVPRRIDTLFFGGGTPTQLPPDRLRRLLAVTRRWLVLEGDYELSVEANPADLDAATVAVLAEFGVSRISIGAQSFNASKLASLERDHGADEIAAAFALARRHVRSVSLDLIFATPGETLSVWETDLARALDLGPDHLSTYGLTLERGSTFWNRLNKGQLTPAGEQLERAMFESAIDTLTSAGFEHYEISNFAQPGHRCRHNEVYWSGQEYYAVGPGAARFVDGRRETNHKSTTTYLKRVLTGQSPVAERETLDPESAARERLVFGLRQLAGIDRQDFAHQTGYPLKQLAGESIRRYVELGMLEDDGVRIRLTREGLMVSDAMWPDFLGPDVAGK